MSATMKGSVGLGPFGRVNLVVRFFTPNTDTEVMKACAPTDSNGDFYIYGITPGAYDVGVKSDQSVSNLAEDKVFTDGNTTEVDFGTLRRGDLDSDDYIGMGDYSIWSTYFNQVGDCYDYAGDWLLPPCPGGAPPPGGACYGYVIT